METIDLTREILDTFDLALLDTCLSTEERHLRALKCAKLCINIINSSSPKNPVIWKQVKKYLEQPNATDLIK